MIRTSKAKQLTSKSEFALFEKSLAREIGKLSLSELRRDVARSRKLADKYRQLAKRQNREARGKQTPQGKRAAQGSDRTQLKHQLFTETLDRYQAQLLKAEAKDAKKSGTAEAAATKARVPGKKSVARKAKSAAAAGTETTTATKATAQEEASAKAAWPKPKTRPGTKSAAKSKGKKATRKKVARGKTGKVEGPMKGAKSAAKRDRLSVSGRVRTKTHVAARTRRNQAKRDSRG